MARRKAPRIPDAILDQLLAGADPKTAFAADGLLDELKKALAERALNAEMDHHLAAEEAGNTRNGYGRKTVTTETGRIELAIPRDRQATFDPQLIARYQRRFPGFDDKIVSMYARGMSTREIVSHLRELYGIEVSPDLISAVTDAVLEEVAAWQARPLEPVYPIVFFDALRIKVRDEGVVRNKAVHIALGVRADGSKEILGLWLEQNEGAKFWLRVMNELRHRGVEDVLLAVVDVSNSVEHWFIRTFGAAGLLSDQALPVSVHAAWRTRWRRRSNPALPYMLRLISFRRLTCPSTGPLLQGSTMAARTAGSSRRSPVTKPPRSVAAAASSQGVSPVGSFWRKRSAKARITSAAWLSFGAALQSASVKARSSGDSAARSPVSHRVMRRVEGIRVDGGRAGAPRFRRAAQRRTIS